MGVDGEDEHAAKAIANATGVNKRGTLSLGWFFIAMSSFVIPCKIVSILIVEVMVNK
ncbi:hypothetical protein A6A12_2163 [Vibrio anguillarum]|nr:hypothetical protein A6A12_2163 [Vibrio anguillarum]